MLLKLELDKENNPMYSALDKKLIKDFYKSRKVRYIEIDFRNAQSLKSLQQLGYLYAVIYPIISNDLGYSIDELEIMFYDMFQAKFIIIKDKEYKYTKTLSKCNMKETAEFITKVIDWASIEHGIYIPPPTKFNEQFKPYANI